MSEELLAAEGLRGARFGPVSVRVEAGGGLVVRAAQAGALDEFVDVVTGLAPARGGRVRLCGVDPAGLAEPRLVQLLAGVGYAGDGEGLLSNLKVWENLVLPLEARGDGGRHDLDALEERVVEAFAVAGLDEAWVQRSLPEVPDRLSDFERIVCGLVRCHLCGFRLLVCDRLFDGIDGRRGQRLAALVDWVGARSPGCGLLVLYHGADEPERRFGLSGWSPIEIVSLEGGSWPDS